MSRFVVKPERRSEFCWKYQCHVHSKYVGWLNSVSMASCMEKDSSGMQHHQTLKSRPTELEERPKPVPWLTESNFKRWVALFSWWLAVSHEFSHKVVDSQLLIKSLSDLDSQWQQTTSLYREDVRTRLYATFVNDWFLFETKFESIWEQTASNIAIYTQSQYKHAMKMNVRWTRFRQQGKRKNI